MGLPPWAKGCGECEDSLSFALAESVLGAYPQVASLTSIRQPSGDVSCSSVPAALTANSTMSALTFLARDGDSHLSREVLKPPILYSSWPWQQLLPLAIRNKPTDVEESFLSWRCWPGCPLRKVGHFSFERTAKGHLPKQCFVHSV